MKLLATAVALSLLSFGAMAQLDKNKDGKISSVEFKAGDPNGDMIITKAEAKACGMSDADFKALDKDQSGAIEAREVAMAG